ncbi:MAG TPA: hypothetical protein VIH42_00005, partial [Thermoguttaceae bacterium]
DIRLVADAMGAATGTGDPLSGVTITMVNDDLVTAGHEIVDYDAVGGTITVHIDAGFTRASHVINKINQAHADGWLPFTAEIDPIDNVHNGYGLVEADATATTRDGSGEPLDQQSGLRIVNSGQEVTIDLLSATTVEELLNTITGAGAGLQAEINATKDGINIRSRSSGADFMIGENGGITATQLGLRTFTEDTELSALNFGSGVADSPTSGSSGGIDFTIIRADGMELDIDIEGATTIGDVLDEINDNPDNADGNLVARLAEYGNGIELVDNSVGPGTLTVVRNPSSRAAVDLGLVPEGESQSTSSSNTLTGADVNKSETEGIFTALLRLRQALETNDTAGIQRSVDLLDTSTLNLNFSRAELGVRQQGLDVIKNRLDSEDIELRKVLSNEYDADITQVASDLVARQTSFEASLRATASIFQMSLMNYL